MGGGGSGGSGGTAGAAGSAGTGGSAGASGSSGTGGAAGSGGMAGSDAATGCPAQMPADQTPCTAQGLLCFYSGGALVDACAQCTEWPCSEQVSECNGQSFVHMDRSSCDGGTEDAGMLDATMNANDASMVLDASVDATSADASTDSSEGLDASVACQPGHYVGSMNGSYTTTAWSNGETPLSLLTEASASAPGLDLWLAPATTPCAPGSAFCSDLAITMGVAHFVLPNVGLRFDAEVTGGLDCRTGEFRGTVAANNFFAGLSFSGPMSATYDAQDVALTNGTWSVTDNATPCSGCGGGGTWSAVWTDSPWNDDDAGAVTDAGVVSDGAVVDDGGNSASPCAGGEICRTSPIAMSYLPPGQGFCAPDNNSSLPPACSRVDLPCGPSRGTCLSLGVCLRACDLPN
jgi:hypothetical protein